MQTLKEQTSVQVENTRKVKPEYIQALDDLIALETVYEKRENALSIADTAPNFQLSNIDGAKVSLEKLLEKGPIILSFYRGSWCPYCNLELKALQAEIPEFNALGAQLVTISPEITDESLSAEEKEKLDFFVLSDQDSNIAFKYGVIWKVPEFILEHMKKDRGLDLAVINNTKGNILPIPSTFIISKEGLISWKYTSIDFRTRAEPEDIILALKKLKEDL